MKKLLLIAMWCAGSAAYCQTDAELCQQSQTAFQQNHFQEAIKLAGRALAKNPEASCRRTRIEAAMKSEVSSVHYLMAISDLDYLMKNGDKGETTYKTLGDAESGLAKLHYDNQNFTEATKHYQKGKEAYMRAKAIANSADYDDEIANADNQMKQANAKK